MNPTDLMKNDFDLPHDALFAGRGELDFEKVRNRTILRRAYAKAPLRLMTPQNYGDAAWVYTSNYGGGLVDGDQIDLRLRVRSHAKAVLLTQSSTKVYRSNHLNPQGSSQTLNCQVESDASLVVMPDPLVCFAGSKFLQCQEFQLQDRASLLLVDTVSSGRHASGERWLFDRLKNQIRVYRGQKPLFIESLLLDSKIGDIAARMGRFNAHSVCVLFGPDFSEFGKAIVASLENKPNGRRSELVCAANSIGSDGFILRMAAVSLEELETRLRDALHFLPDYLGDSPWARRF